MTIALETRGLEKSFGGLRVTRDLSRGTVEVRIRTNNAVRLADGTQIGRAHV